MFWHPYYDSAASKEIAMGELWLLIMFCYNNHVTKLLRVNLDAVSDLVSAMGNCHY